MKKNVRITKKDVLGLVDFYRYFEFECPLEILLIAARYNAGSQRKSDAKRLQKLVYQGIAAKDGPFDDPLFASIVKEAKQSLKKWGK